MDGPAGLHDELGYPGDLCKQAGEDLHPQVPQVDQVAPVVVVVAGYLQLLLVEALLTIVGVP